MKTLRQLLALPVLALEAVLYGLMLLILMSIGSGRDKDKDDK